MCPPMPLGCCNGAGSQQLGTCCQSLPTAPGEGEEPVALDSLAAQGWRAGDSRKPKQMTDMHPTHLCHPGAPMLCDSHPAPVRNSARASACGCRRRPCGSRGPGSLSQAALSVYGVQGGHLVPSNLLSEMEGDLAPALCRGSLCGVLALCSVTSPMAAGCPRWSCQWGHTDCLLRSGGLFPGNL